MYFLDLDDVSFYGCELYFCKLMKLGLPTAIPFLGDRFVLGIPFVSPPIPLGIGLFFCAALCKNR